jgi:serine-type D-Ala-D-Ala carboxypeptidase/endopeptidase (penicillin-binding protein 4)
LTAYSSPPTIRFVRRTGALLAALAVLAGVGSASAVARVDAREGLPRPSAGRDNSALERRLAKALRVPHVSPALSSAVAVDLRTGQQLFALNDSLPLAPASNEKLALTYALLTTLGPTHRIETEVVQVGTRRGATLDGGLVLVGGGDPSLTGSDLGVLARSVRAAGIRRITGGIVGDESLFDTKRTCPGWKPSFYMLESPPLSALVVDHARYGKYVAQRPAKAAALLFRKALGTAGVRVDRYVAVGRAPAGAPIVARHVSAPLATIVRVMDLESDNFTAEELLKLLSLSAVERGTTAAGAAIVTKALQEAGVPTAGVRIVDGSGLSLDDRLTTQALLGILQAFADDTALQPVLLHALPVAGKSGTLRDRMRTRLLSGHVIAKTGTTDVASSLSGYVNDHIAFAIIENGRPLSSWYARIAQDRFTTVLAKQG